MRFPFQKTATGVGIVVLDPPTCSDEMQKQLVEIVLLPETTDCPREERA